MKPLSLARSRLSLVFLLSPSVNVMAVIRRAREDEAPPDYRMMGVERERDRNYTFHIDFCRHRTIPSHILTLEVLS